MPTLQFKGKNIIWNHHMSVPYHTLEPVPELDYNTDKANGNLIVEGDNLVALKALLPQYSASVKCIYIDPPYNTGQEGWIYNDNVNSPMINEWIGREVGKEDLTKHDKWLCMMVPRLKLLREFLSHDGVIFISIGDHESHNLQQICNEIFGENNFLGRITWKARVKPINIGDPKYKPQKEIEYVLVYQKQEGTGYFRPLFTGGIRSYPNEFNGRKYRLATILKSNRGANYRNTMSFPLENNGYAPPEGQRWQAGHDEIHRLWDEEYIEFNSEGTPMRRYFEDEEGAEHDPLYCFMEGEWSSTSEAGKHELNKLLGPNHGFDTVKPTRLIQTLLSVSTDKDSLILDSYGGSGTTMHAMMELNKEDEGNRRCILVQMPENSEKEPDKNICKDITRERIVKAIEKYDYDSGFNYIRVGQALDAETLLSGELPPYEAFSNYVYYLATGEHLADDTSIDFENYFIGSKDTQNLYLIYSDTMDTLQSLALNFEKAEAFRTHAGANKITVYAPACFLDDEYLQEHNIEFVSIPYNLFNKAEEA